MTDAASPKHHPLITEARLKVAGSGRPVWDLYAAELLVGWTATDPAKPPTYGEGLAIPFTPSCQQYGTGRHVVVEFAKSLKVSS